MLVVLLLTNRHLVKENCRNRRPYISVKDCWEVRFTDPWHVLVKSKDKHQRLTLKKRRNRRQDVQRGDNNTTADLLMLLLFLVEEEDPTLTPNKGSGNQFLNVNLCAT